VAFPEIVTTNTTNGTTAGTSVTVNLPGGLVAGNLLVSIHRAAGAGAIGWPTGWVELVESTADASDDVTAIAWKAVNGTEGATMTVTQGSQKFANICLQISGAYDPGQQPPQISTAATGTSTTPDPTLLTPTGGSKDYMWLWLGGWEGEQTSPPASNPSGYLGGQGADSGTASTAPTNCRVARAVRFETTASQDPGSWTISVSDDWTAWVMAVHPVPPGGGELHAPIFRSRKGYF
jgi:hypothetical protein